MSCARILYVGWAQTALSGPGRVLSILRATSMSSSPSPGSMVRNYVTCPRRRFTPGLFEIVRIHAPIQGGGRTVELVELLRHLRESRRVPAVVIDIDSPGGSATASADLYMASRRLADAKPVVAAI